MFPFLTREFSCKFTCTALSFLCLTEKKESLDSSAGAEQRGNVICCCFYGRWAPAQRVHVTPILTKSTVTSHHPQQRNWTYITVPLASTTELWGHYMPLHVMWPLMQIPSATRKLKTSCFWYCWRMCRLGLKKRSCFTYFCATLITAEREIWVFVHQDDLQCRIVIKLTFK